MEIVEKDVKKKNPKERSNPLSTLLFFYMIPVFIRNYRKGVKHENLFEPLKEHRSKILADKLNALWKDASKKYEKFALHIALFKLFAFELIITGVLKLILELTLVVVLPTSIDRIVSYFDNELDTSLQQAAIYSGVLIACLFIDIIIEHHTMLALLHTCMKMRVSCCSLIYRKSLRLSKTSLAQTTIGQIVNLISNDVGKFEESFVLCHFIFIGPIQTILVTYLLYRILGVAAFSGIAFLVMFIPLQIYLGKQISKLRLRTAGRTDERLRLMNEILNGVQVIKMYTWEKPFAKLIDLARRKEINSIRAHFCLESVMFSFEMFITRTCLFISLIVFVALGSTLSADVVYAATSIYNFVRPVMTMLFSISIASYAEVHISITRIQAFLRYEEQPENVTTDTKHNLICPSSSPKLTIKALCAKWIENSSNDTLTDINIDLQGNKLTAIIGAVGSGKSSLFNLILNELHVTKGDMQLQGLISYASQEPWLFSASVKQNILFFNKYDKDRYNTVLKVCSLEPDLATFPHGDQTIIGEKGKLLSGGQKARINLARCIYKESDIYLLDDPLSAVDSKVGKDLFEKCIKSFLKDKMCLLITHQLQYLSKTDKILIVEDGKIIEEGTFQELQTSSMNFSKTLRQFNVDDDSHQEEKTLKSRQNSEISETFDKLEDDLEEEKEHLATGHIKASVYLSYLKAGGNYLIIFFVVLAFVGNQVITNGGDYYVSYWVNLEQEAKETNNTALFDRDHIIYTYSGLTGANIIFAIGHNLLFFLFAMRASVTLHNDVFRQISKASMSYYNANPTGRILNRFSKDIGNIDDYIPYLLTDIIEIILMLIGAVVLSALVNVWFLIPSFVLFISFYFFRLVFLETSRSVKRIEAINRSPIISHLTASVSGLTTIRAFSAQNMLIQEYDDLQDNHSSASYLFILSSRAFGFWIDMISNTFISGIILSLLLLPTDYYGGEIGLVITQYLGVYGVLQWGMRQWTELENNMTSVERVLELYKVQLEPMRDLSNTPKLWPEIGKIVFQNVSMSYTDNVPVLQNLDFTINPAEKIGVAGRTGAGKTSTIAALFQLYEIEGSIIIDDIDTTKLSLELLRSKISIIPQEPILFKGTMRRNLDPFEEYSDDIIWHALDQVELKSIVYDSPAGLNMEVSENGSNFSIGQKQLICLARAIVRNNKILIMDEATANVDPYTDNLIQKSIRTNFLHSTVITIAHRLHTIMDSDKVLVIEGGKVVEFDHPYNLLQRTDGIFYAMVETTGNKISEDLYSIAEESFSKMKTS